MYCPGVRGTKLNESLPYSIKGKFINMECVIKIIEQTMAQIVSLGSQACWRPGNLI